MARLFLNCHFAFSAGVFVLAAIVLNARAEHGWQCDRTLEAFFGASPAIWLWATAQVWTLTLPIAVICSERKRQPAWRWCLVGIVTSVWGLFQLAVIEMIPPVR
jgi:hypothetical protein